MGEGKTEAGAYAAFCMGKYYGKKGFYVALPTSATANQMHRRMENLVKQLFHNKEVRLLHSLAWLIDETTKEKREFISEDADNITTGIFILLHHISIFKRISCI